MKMEEGKDRMKVEWKMVDKRGQGNRKRKKKGETGKRRERGKRKKR